MIKSNVLWVEKYRPKTLDDIVLSESLKQKVYVWLENPKANLPNLILLGPPGCGKTSLALVLVRHMIGDPTDYLYINGSAERGIQSIKENVSEFMRFEPTSMSPVKILFIDEADNLTADAFKALRSMMESYHETCRIIMTGNYDTFPEAIASRCVVIKFESLPKEVVNERLRYILENENVLYTDEAIERMIDLFYPDMRKIVNYSQLLANKYGALAYEYLDELLEERDILHGILWRIFVSKVNDVTSLKLQFVETVKKTSLSLQDFLNLLQRFERRLDAEFFGFLQNGSKPDLTGKLCNMYMQLKSLISDCALKIRQSPIPEGFLFEFVVKLIQYKSVYASVIEKCFKTE